MNITVTNVERKISFENKPLIRFALNIVEGDRVLLTMNGFLIGPEWEITPPAVFSFARRRLRIFELEAKFRDQELRPLLAQIPDVVAHLGASPVSGKEHTVEVE